MPCLQLGALSCRKVSQGPLQGIPRISSSPMLSITKWGKTDKTVPTRFSTSLHVTSGSDDGAEHVSGRLCCSLSWLRSWLWNAKHGVVFTYTTIKFLQCWTMAVTSLSIMLYNFMLVSQNKRFKRECTDYKPFGAGTCLFLHPIPSFIHMDGAM